MQEPERESTRAYKIPLTVEQELVRYERLQQWADKSLTERCALIEAEWGLKIVQSTLMLLYRRHGVSYRNT